MICEENVKAEHYMISLGVFKLQPSVCVFSPKSIFNKGRAFGKKMWLDSNEGKQQSKVPTVAGSRAKPPGIEILLLVEMKQEEAWIILYDWPGYCGDREERVSTSDNLEDWMAKKPLRFKAQGT